MKFIYASIAGFIVIILLCALSAGYVLSSVQETKLLLEAAMETEISGAKEDTVDQVRNARKNWEHHQKFFGTVLRHDEVDTITEEFAKLESYASTEDHDDFRSSCKALLFRLDHICEMEKLSLQNIM